MSEEERQVRLFKQSYNEADELFHGDLEPIGLVSVLEDSIELANKNLKRDARELGATHIFGVDYRISLAGEGSHKAHKIVLAYGDAYSTLRK